MNIGRLFTTLLLVIIWGIVGSYLEDHNIITDAPGWALYGFLFGIICGGVFYGGRGK